MQDKTTPLLNTGSELDPHAQDRQAGRQVIRSDVRADKPLPPADLVKQRATALLTDPGFVRVDIYERAAGCQRIDVPPGCDCLVFIVRSTGKRQAHTTWNYALDQACRTVIERGWPHPRRDLAGLSGETYRQARMELSDAGVVICSGKSTRWADDITSPREALRRYEAFTKK